MIFVLTSLIYCQTLEHLTEKEKEGTLKLVVKEAVRELENCQHVSPEAYVSLFPFIFFNLSGFSTLLVTTCLLRLFTQDFYHGTTMIDNTKTRSCTVRATYLCKDNLNLLEDNTQLS